jgi:hypothetical protein
MPALVVRESSQVPPPRKDSASVAQQRLYEGFIREVGANNVGELDLGDGEETRPVKTRLTRAAKRIGTELQIWDADGKVYFKNAAETPKRGRPKKA